MDWVNVLFIFILFILKLYFFILTIILVLHKRKYSGEDPQVILNERVYSKYSSSSERPSPLYYFVDPKDSRNTVDKLDEDEGKFDIIIYL